jgi:hypothetical protein
LSTSASAASRSMSAGATLTEASSRSLLESWFESECVRVCECVCVCVCV